MVTKNEIRLRWTSHQGTILSIFDALLTSEALVDVTLAAEGQYIRAHKVILSACSPYFQELLALDSSKHPILFMKDVKYAELKALVQYMYRGEVNIPQDDLQTLLSVAQSLKIRGLAEVESTNCATTSTTAHLPSDTLVFPNLPISTTKSQNVPPPVQASQPCSQQSSFHQSQPAPAPVSVQHVLKTSPAPKTYAPAPARVQATQPVAAPRPTKRPRIESSISLANVNPAPVPVLQVLVDPLATDPGPNMDMDTEHLNFIGADLNLDQDDQSFSVPTDTGENEIEIENGVKHEVVTIDDDEEHNMEDEHEDDENSMSHSSFNDTWNQSLSTLPVDDGEVPGTSGGGTGSRTNETEAPFLSPRVKLEYLSRPRGNPWLLVNGFTYSRKKVSGTTTYWRCTERGTCKVQIKTRNGNVYPLSGIHSHGINSCLARINRLKVQKLKAEQKQGS